MQIYMLERQVEDIIKGGESLKDSIKNITMDTAEDTAEPAVSTVSAVNTVNAISVMCRQCIQCKYVA